MALELTLMTVSGLGMIGLLVHKHYENRGLETRATEVREKIDPALENVHSTTGRILSGLTVHNVVLALNHAFVHVVRFFMNLFHRAHKASSDLVEKASKKTEDLSRRGAASFYLKQIKDAKESSDEAREINDTSVNDVAPASHNDEKAEDSVE